MKIIITDCEVAELIQLLQKLKKDNGAKGWIKHLREQIHEQASTQDYQEAARASSDEGHIEVDDNATVSHGSDPGAYVQAWLWVSKEEMLDVRRARLAQKRKEKLDRC